MINRLVFAFDIDGTILNSKGELVRETKNALKSAKEAGHILVLCSGRPYFDMVSIAEAAPYFDFFVCNNGAYFYDLNNKQFHVTSELHKEDVITLKDISEKHQTFFAAHTTQGVYRAYSWVKPPVWAKSVIADEWYRFKLISLAEVEKIIQNEHVTQASIRATKEIIAGLKSETVKALKNVEVHIAGEVYLDINPKGVSKLTGLEKLSHKLNIPMSFFVAFGDSNNDLQMLSGAGLGIAMGNSTPEAKAAAKEVIGDNNSPAIAFRLQAILHNIKLGKK